MTETTRAADSGYQTERYNPQELERRWQRHWQEQGLYTVDLNDDTRPKFFFLTMYPYPSGDLHVGHWYASAPADAAARYRRMQGFNVLFPMGFDAFGLPAENAAIKAANEGALGVHPASLTYQRIAHMEKQFGQMGAMFDWSKKVVSCDPEFYRWNQYFFVRMYERGLAYRKESYVNWDPVDKTVLANEQVVDGRGERSGAVIERRLMPQWHFRITAYADELLDFSGLDWPERVKTMQTNWIGRSEGADVTFTTESGDAIEVFTTRPDTLWGATFMVLAPEHPLVARLTTPERKAAVDAYVERAARMTELDRQAEGKSKTGEFLGSYALNPVNGKRVPIWIADYVLTTYGTGAIMAVPAHDARDFAFARAFGLDVVPVIQPEGQVLDGATMTEAFAGDGVMVNSGPFDGTPSGKEGDADGIRAVIAWLEAQGKGRGKVSYRLRDWLISRQRYWGTPIPMLYCERCGIQPEKLENLPVVLPTDVAFMPTGESPLNSHPEFTNATCPHCGGPARRETDTMDTFMDSSWYWFRYLSPHKADGPFDRALVDRWTPVDMYTGGIEHAILHLLYARFFTKVLRDLGLVQNDEPFLRLRNQGMILGEDHEKMSKSRGNVVNPDPLVREYGADAVRTYLMFIGPWDQGSPWSYQGIEGVTRFLNRVWSVVNDPAPEAGAGVAVDGAGNGQAGAAAGSGRADAGEGAGRGNGQAGGGSSAEPELTDLRRATHLAIRNVSEDFEAFRFNTAVAELMTLQNAMTRAKTAQVATTEVWGDAKRALLLMLAPIAPHIAEELWHRAGFAGSVHEARWPAYDPAALVQDTITMAVQINGKVRAQISVAADAGKDAVLAAARLEPKVARYLDGAAVKREIVVPGKLVSFVLG